MIALGSTVGRYRIESLIGEGDLASTFRVSADGVPYALRVLVVRDQGFSDRLRRASAAQANADHPNLLRVVDVVEADGLPGVVTEFVEGSDLEQWIADGPHPPAEVLTVFRQMVEGVRAAHGAGLLHRNLKPSKVLVGRNPDGSTRVRIADFLLGKVRASEPGAAVTQLGTTFGTPQYMSPEQFRGAATVDERGDLFALGCLLYEMATGERAFDGKNLLEVYQQVCVCDYRPLEQVRFGLPGWVRDLVAALLKPEPADRIQTADELLERIRAIGARMTPIPPLPAPLGTKSSRSPASYPGKAGTADKAGKGGGASRLPARLGDPAPPLARGPSQASGRTDRSDVPSGGRSDTPSPGGTDTPSFGSASDTFDVDSLAPRSRSPTLLLVGGALALGLFVGLLLVTALGIVVFWWLGAL